MATIIISAKLAKLGHRRREIMDTIKDLQEEKARIESQLEVLDPEVTYEAGDLIIRRSPYRELDKAAIEKKFPASKRPEFYKLTLDTAEFKKHFSQKDLEEYQTITYRINVKDA